MINIPFNFQPATVTTKSGTSHTVAAGHYAYVTASCKDNGQVTINGTVVLSVDDTGSSGAGIAQSSAYTVPSGYIFDGQVTCSSTANVTVAGVVAGQASTTTAVSVKAGSGDQITTASGTPHITGFIYKPSPGTTSVSGGFWVKSGDVIAGITPYYLNVSEFAEIS